MGGCEINLARLMLRHTGNRMRRQGLVLVLTGGLAGCTVYHAEPLPEAPVLATVLPRPQMSLDAVARYAVEHSPDLVAERRKTDVSEAQAYEGGLLPDPQLIASNDFPTNDVPGTITGYSLGLAQDLQALLTQPSRAAGAKAKADQARLDLLWAEWQTLQNAAHLYTQTVYANDKLDALKRTSEILRVAAERSTRALTQHNTTVDVAGADLSAALDLASQEDAAARAALTADSDLKALLGIAPEAVFGLMDPGDPPAVPKNDVEHAIAQVAQKRPDLLALQAGYHAQNEAVRTAILQQFPALNLGFHRAADTSNIQSVGADATVSIPIFGSTQARIGTEQATRAQLRAEYQARLDQTVADAWRVWRELGLLRDQIANLEKTVPELRRMAEAGRDAYAAGNLAPATYVLLETSLSAREGELFDLKASAWDDTIALRTLLAITPLIEGTDPGCHSVECETPDMQGRHAG